MAQGENVTAEEAAHKDPGASESSAAERAEHIATRLKAYRELAGPERARQLWQLWQAIAYEQRWPDWYEHQDAIFAEMIDTGDAAIDLLLHEIQVGQGEAVEDAVCLLGDFGIKAVEKLLPLLDEAGDHVQRRALSALWYCVGHRDVDGKAFGRIDRTARKALRHASPEVRLTAEVLRDRITKERTERVYELVQVVTETAADGKARALEVLLDYLVASVPADARARARGVAQPLSRHESEHVREAASDVLRRLDALK